MNELKERAQKLGLKSIAADWDRYASESWLADFISAEEQERQRRNLERRLREAQIGQFKPMSEFDWSWPTKINREHIEELLTLDFMNEKANAVLVGTNGLGKTMIAQNLASNALSRGYSTKFVKASQMLNQLHNAESPSAHRRCLKRFCSPDLLLIDEVGYLSYSNSYADLLYEVISGRYQNASTVITTNRGFKQWGEIFPNAACVVTMVDRLTHKAETVLIEGESYRQHEALARAEAKEKERRSRKGKTTAKREEVGATC
jgi:DNA replication protein DnaC